MEILLSKSTTPIIGQIAMLLGWIMNLIYEGLSAVGIANIGLAILVFTIVIYVLMTPLQIKQQKSSKMMAIMQPEVQKIQKKYEGKRDQISQQRMQEETMALYQKYGVSMTGTCLPLAVQMPLLFAVYQVIYHIPGYITRVKGLFTVLASDMLKVDGLSDLLTTFVTDNGIKRISMAGELTENKIIDFLYILKPAQWKALGEVSQFSGLTSEITKTAQAVTKVNQFLGINISESPWDAIKAGLAGITSGKATGVLIIGLIIGILVPVLAWFTQWLTVKLMPQQTKQDDKSNTANTMNQMNTFMPVFSAIICVTLSMGIGIYWIFGAVVRIVQQVLINRALGKTSPEEMIRISQEKAETKKKNSKDYVSNISQNARTNVKKIAEPRYDNKNASEKVDYYRNADNSLPNSITAKANMVRRFDEKNSTKNTKGSK